MRHVRQRLQRSALEFGLPSRLLLASRRVLNCVELILKELRQSLELFAERDVPFTVQPENI